MNKKTQSTGAPTIRTSFALQPATAHSSKGTAIPFQFGMISWNREYTTFITMDLKFMNFKTPPVGSPYTLFNIYLKKIKQ
jgi:hypothetical protein